MKHMNYSLLLFCLVFNLFSFGQSFIRTELPTVLSSPWEITYGPDGYLWISEKNGTIARVDPFTGSKNIVYTASEYFPGSPSEQLTLCHTPMIGAGTMGLALHPDFLINDSSFLYLFYSYNAGTALNPKTSFKIARIKWDSALQTAGNETTILENIPSGYDHLGGRLLAVKQANRNFLYVSIGDHGISEDNSPGCYIPSESNPNNFTQHPDSLNGKILRLNLNGSVPYDNPIPGNPMFTRGHRNPQGFAFNSEKELVYDIEHGDRTDDELNLLKAGMNYGWKTVRGFPEDESFPNEATVYANYTPHPLIANDRLVSPIFSWCTVPPPPGSPNSDWCTVAPSDGIYYGNKAIHQWKNSVLVTTLKDGTTTDKSVHLIRLSEDGTSLCNSTLLPNHEILFAEDQSLNGRLRDITLSPDGRTVFLINNGGTDRDKITVYHYNPSADLLESELLMFPNPASTNLYFTAAVKLKQIQIFDSVGKLVWTLESEDITGISISSLSDGVYSILALGEDQIKRIAQFIKK